MVVRLDEAELQRHLRMCEKLDAMKQVVCVWFGREEKRRLRGLHEEGGQDQGKFVFNVFVASSRGEDAVSGGEDGRDDAGVAPVHLCA